MNFADNLFAKVTTVLRQEGEKVAEKTRGHQNHLAAKTGETRRELKKFPLRSDATISGIDAASDPPRISIFLAKGNSAAAAKRERQSLSDVGNQTKMTLKCFDESRKTKKKEESTNPPSSFNLKRGEER